MNLTTDEIKALVSRCKQHTGIRESKVLLKAVGKLEQELQTRTATTAAPARKKKKPMWVPPDMETCLDRERRSISVARAIVVNSKGEVLLLRRAFDCTDGGRYCLPGGKVDGGEAIGEAAKRELREETQIVVDHLSFLFYLDGGSPGPGEKHYIQFYLQCCSDTDPILNKESIAFAWVGPNGLHSVDIAFGDKAAIMRFFKEGLLSS